MGGPCSWSSPWYGRCSSSAGLAWLAGKDRAVALARDALQDQGLLIFETWRTWKPCCTIKDRSNSTETWRTWRRCTIKDRSYLGHLHAQIQIQLKLCALGGVAQALGGIAQSRRIKKDRSYLKLGPLGSIAPSRITQI